MKKISAVMSWSGGKDSAMALYQAIRSNNYEIKYLMTSVSADDKRISMHDVPFELLKKQSEEIGIPLFLIELPPGSTSMEEYDRIMAGKMMFLKEEGVETILFGDIFLEHLRDYRKKQLEKSGLKAEFPIWGKSTNELANFFLEEGFEALTACVHADYLSKEFAGRKLDQSFFDELPGNVDPCGENGEYHSFVFNGPIFRKKVPFEVSEILEFVYPPPPEDDGIHKMKETRVYFTRFKEDI